MTYSGFWSFCLKQSFLRPLIQNLESKSNDELPVYQIKIVTAGNFLYVQPWTQIITNNFSVTS